MRLPSTRRLAAIMLLTMAGVNAWVLWESRLNWYQGYGDFTAFYTAGKLVLRGQSAQLYERDAQWAVQQEFASQVKIRRGGPLPYIRPPFQAVFFAAFALCPYPAALLLWTAFKWVLLLFIPVLVVRDREWHRQYPPWLVTLLAFGTFPIFMDFLLGQDAVLLAFLFAVAFRQFVTGCDRAAGLTLGLGMFKFHLVLPFALIAFLAGKRRLVPGFVLVVALEVAVSAALVGWQGLAQYPSFVLSLSRLRGVAIMRPDAYINLRGLLMLFFGPSRIPTFWNVALLLSALLVIIYVGALWRRTGRERPAECFALALISAILTSYYAGGYDLTLLVVPLIAILAQTREAFPNSASWLVSAGVLVLLFTPLYWSFVEAHLRYEYVITLPLIAIAGGLAAQLQRPAPHSMPVTERPKAQS